MIQEKREWHGHALLLYSQRRNDREIAKELGLSPTTIFCWRKKNLLSAVPSKTKIDYNKVLDLYNQGKSDSQIATVLSIATSTVCRWRLNNNLPPNDLFCTDTSRISDLYYQGKNDVEIAKELGMATSQILYWRCNHNLPKNIGGQPKMDDTIDAFIYESKQESFMNHIDNLLAYFNEADEQSEPRPDLPMN